MKKRLRSLECWRIMGQGEEREMEGGREGRGERENFNLLILPMQFWLSSWPPPPCLCRHLQLPHHVVCQPWGSRGKCLVVTTITNPNSCVYTTMYLLHDNAYRNMPWWSVWLIRPSSCSTSLSWLNSWRETHGPVSLVSSQGTCCVYQTIVFRDIFCKSPKSGIHPWCKGNSIKKRSYDLNAEMRTPLISTPLNYTYLWGSRV